MQLLLDPERQQHRDSPCPVTPAQGRLGRQAGGENTLISVPPAQQTGGRSQSGVARGSGEKQHGEKTGAAAAAEGSGAGGRRGTPALEKSPGSAFRPTAPLQLRSLPAPPPDAAVPPVQQALSRSGRNQANPAPGARRGGPAPAYGLIVAIPN